MCVCVCWYLYIPLIQRLRQEIRNQSNEAPLTGGPKRRATKLPEASGAVFASPKALLMPFFARNVRLELGSTAIPVPRCTVSVAARKRHSGEGDSGMGEGEGVLVCCASYCYLLLVIIYDSCCNPFFTEGRGKDEIVDAAECRSLLKNGWFPFVAIDIPIAKINVLKKKNHNNLMITMY